MKLIKNGEIATGKQTYVVELQRIVTIEIPVVEETREGAATKAIEVFRSDKKCLHATSWSKDSELLIDSTPKGAISPKDWLDENYGDIA